MSPEVRGSIQELSFEILQLALAMVICADVQMPLQPEVQPQHTGLASQSALHSRVGGLTPKEVHFCAHAGSNPRQKLEAYSYARSAEHIPIGSACMNYQYS